MGFRPHCFTCKAHLYLYSILFVPHTYTSYIRHWYIFFHWEIQYNLPIFLTWYQNYFLVAMIFCSYGIFKSNLYLPRCFFFCCVHLLWLLTVAVKTLRYSQATVRSRINTARPLPFLNYRHRAKLHSRDLLNLIKSQDFIKFSSWVWEGVLEIY